MSEDETYYEMCWDCPACGAAGLLAKSQRHCPGCGAAQDPAKRYFPPPGQETAVPGHRYAGADWRCDYCASPNGAAAAFCGNCGGSKDGTREVARVADPLAAAASASAPIAATVAPPKPVAWRWRRFVFAVFAAAAVAFALKFFSQHEETMKVAGHGWTREVRIDRFQAVDESAWCDAVPAGARDLRRTREVKETRQVEDGQSCREVRADQGDGTFTRKQECAPRYRSEAVYADKCHFRVHRWATGRTATASGDLTLAPAWPAIQLAGGGIAAWSGQPALGAERENGRSERYAVHLVAANGKTHVCELPFERWRRFETGQEVRLLVRGTGGAACDSLPQ